MSNEKEVSEDYKLWRWFIVWAGLTLNSIIWAIAAYNIADRIGPVRTITTTTVVQAGQQSSDGKLRVGGQ